MSDCQIKKAQFNDCQILNLKNFNFKNDIYHREITDDLNLTPLAKLKQLSIMNSNKLFK